MLLLAVVAAALALQGQPARAGRPSCDALAEKQADPAAIEMCRGDEARERALAPRKDPVDAGERTAALVTAADHYRRAANLATDINLKVRALDAVARIYDPGQLNDPIEVENALLDLDVLQPEDLTYLYRLARSQEARGLFEAAEGTLQVARQRQPDEPEPYRQLSALFTRRADAAQAAQNARNLAEVVAEFPPRPEANGAYRVGFGVAPPKRIGEAAPPTPPPGARGGVVALEITIDASGVVTGAQVVRSIPALDAAALDYVRQWRYEPATLNGSPVPVVMRATVSF